MINNKKALVAIGARLRNLRVGKGFENSRDFCKRHKLAEIQYWRVENGKSNVTMKTLTRLLNIHKMSLSEFFRRL